MQGLPNHHPKSRNMNGLERKRSTHHAMNQLAWRMGLAVLLSASMLFTLFPHPSNAAGTKEAKIKVASTASAMSIKEGSNSASSTVKVEQVNISEDKETRNGKPEGYDKLKPEQKKAVDSVLKLFPMLAQAKVQDVTKGDKNAYPDRYPTSWRIDWMHATGNSTHSFNSIVDSKTYEVIQTSLSFYPELTEDISYYPPQLNEEQALNKAWSIMAEAMPSVKIEDMRHVPDHSYLAPQPLFGQTMYTFIFKLKVNGIESDQDQVTVRIDGNGQLYEFYRGGGTGDYPSVSKIKITEEQALKRLTSQLSFEPQYMPVQGNRNNTVYKLAYIPVSGYAPLNAITGEEVMQPWGGVDKKESMKPFSAPKGIKPFQASKTPIGDADAALAAIERHFKVPSDYHVTNRSLNPDWNNPEREVWALDWIKLPTTGPWMDNYSARVDAKTGQILEFGQQRYGGIQIEDANGSVDAAAYKKAQQKAVETVYALLPDAEHTVRLIQTPEKDRKPSKDGTMTIRFAQYVNEHPVSGGNVSVVVNKDGSILQYFSNIVPVEKLAKLPQSPSITPEQAKRAWLDGMNLQLQYRTEGGYLTYEGEVPLVTYLVYQFKAKDDSSQEYLVDAVTGQLFSAWVNDREVKVHTGETPIDIKGHAVEAELLALWKHGVISQDQDNRIHPNQKLTYGDFLQMLVYGFRPELASSSSVSGINSTLPFSDIEESSSYYAAVKWAYDSKWLSGSKDASKRLNLERTMTREEAAQLLVKLVHYDKLAVYMQNDKQVLSLSDQGQITAKGEVAVALNLGLMEAKSGAFDPKGVVTRADAAKIMIALAKLQGRTDQNIG